MSVLQIKTNPASSAQAIYPHHLLPVVNENEVDEVFYSSFAAQISDMSLQVFISLNRLVFPQTEAIAARISLVDSSFLRQCYKDPLEYFEESQDLIRLESILRILEGGRLNSEGVRILPTLSRYFEALSVYGGTLTASHWVFEEDRLSLTIWSMLSYYCHCLNEFSPEFSHVLDLISEALVGAFRKDAPVLREIFEYEKIKEQRDYLVLKRIELQVRKFYELTWEQPALEQGGENMNRWGLSALRSFPECEELKEIKNRKIFSPKEKNKRSEKVWDALSSSHPVRDLVTESEEVIRISQTIDALENEMSRKKPIIERKTQMAALNKVKKTIQGLYEYEQLKSGLQCTEQLFGKNHVPPGALTQWLVVLRESLKMMVTDKSLNIPTSHSLLILSNRIKTIRDYFEHPEDYVLKLDCSEEARKKKQLQSLEADLFAELETMGQRIIQLMRIRLEKIHQILRPHPSIDPQNVLVALASRNAQQESGLSNFRDLFSEQYPKLMEFAKRVIDKKNLKTEGNEEKSGGKEKIDVKKEFLFIPCSQNLSSGELLERLQEGCEALRSTTSSLSRGQLERKIVEEMAFRLMIQRQISVVARLLEQFMKKLNHKNSAYTTLEGIYFDARDARNFQTHDLWRKDIQGVVNSVYLLGYECPEVLSSLLESAPFKKNSLEDHIIKQVINGELTQDILNQAISDGFNLNAYDYKIRSLLHFLAERPSEKNLRIAQFVIENGGNIHLADYVEKRPLHYAAESGFIQMAQLLVDQGAVVDAHSRGGTPTELAQILGHTALAQFLSHQRGVRRSSNAKALIDAVNSLDLEKIRHLIAENFDPLADFEGSLPLVALFEKEGIDPEIQIDIAKILFQAGADINQQEPHSGQSVLHAAATYTDKAEVIEFLMSFRPYINLQDGQRRTPLHNAVCCENEGWVKRLLQAGALVNEKDSLGNTPLLEACNMTWPSSEIVEALLKHGADVEAENEFGKVIHYAVERGRGRTASIVLAHGASPFAVRQKGLYYRKMPHELSTDSQVTNRLIERMQFLFFHLSEEDQERLITITGRDLRDWKRSTLPTAQQEREFLGRLYQRRFCWIS